MGSAFLGEIVLFAGSFAPRQWAFCQGQMMPIAQNSALFSILGTTYGGNGTTTFALPDLRSRYPIGQGQGTGLTNFDLGEQGGQENVTLTVPNLASHNHPVNAIDNDGAAQLVSGNLLTNSPSGTNLYGPPASGNAQMAPQMIGATGSNVPFDVHPPYLGLNYIICTEGMYPSRN